MIDRLTAAGVVSLGMGVGVAFAQPAAPDLGPAQAFTEDFEGGLGGFEGNGSLGFGASIVSDSGNSFLRTTGSVPPAGGGFGAATVISNNTGFGEPLSNFSGDYSQGGINEISFDVRHDADQAINFAIRLAAPVTNFPGAIILSTQFVAAGSEFTRVTFFIDQDGPFFIDETGGAFSDLRGVGNLQILVSQPDTPFSGAVTFDFDNITIVPAAPTSAALLAGAGAVLRRRRA